MHVTASVRVRPVRSSDFSPDSQLPHVAMSSHVDGALCKSMSVEVEPCGRRQSPDSGSRGGKAKVKSRRQAEGRPCLLWEPPLSCSGILGIFSSFWTGPGSTLTFSCGRSVWGMRFLPRDFLLAKRL